MELTGQLLVDYAPVIIVVLAFCFKNKIFVTPAQMKEEKEQLLKEAENRFLTLLAFNEYKKRVDDNIHGVSERLGNIEQGITHITEILLQKG